MKPALAIAFLLAFSSASAAQTCDQGKATKTAEGLLSIGFFRHIGTSSEGLRLEVMHDRWLSFPTSERLKYAQVMECAIAGPGKAVRAIFFISNRTGQQLNRYSADRLQ